MQHTLLEIYELHSNGNKREFIKAVKEYGVTDFLRDIETERRDGVLTRAEVSSMGRIINNRE